MWVGNIRYHDLSFDNGDPVVKQGGGVTTTPINGYDENKTSVRGYFRDEVYRFAVVYMDKYGNRSAAKPLNMANVSGNTSSQVGFKDMKFPSRTNSVYSIINENGLPTRLGLSILLDNHPTWAVAFEIVRVKRKKRILFQTPVVPMMSIKGIGAKVNYPSKQYQKDEGSSSADNVDYPNAQPQTSGEVFVPKNMLWPELRDIVEVDALTASAQGVLLGTGSTGKKVVKGEATLLPRVKFLDGVWKTHFDLCAIFPQSTLYSSKPYVFTGSESLDTVDFCLTKVDIDTFGSTVVSGDNIDTNLSATFYGLQHGDYFFNSGTPEKVLPTLTGATVHKARIIDNLTIDNFSTGGVVGGKNVLQYKELDTVGITWAKTPTAHKMVITKLDSPMNDNHSIPFLNGTKNAWNHSSPVKVVGAAGIAHEILNTTTNKFVDQYTGWTNQDYVQAIRIANVIDDKLDDNRYGDPDDNFEYISTGAAYRFTQSQIDNSVTQSQSLPISIDVAGGDCFVSVHTFKICDRTYSVVAQNKHCYSIRNTQSTGNLLTNFKDKLYKYGDSKTENTEISLPIAVDGAAQFIQVYLESEYMGEVMDEDILKKVDSVNNKPILNLTDKNLISVPLTYNYNINLSKQNDQKVYLPKPEFTFEQNDFPSRFMFSDQKIYNSDIQGFDIIRVLNFVDLDEALGELTKLAIETDALYGIQERGVVYIPTGQTQLETTDGGSLSVGTSDIVGRLSVINASRGGQHLKGIKETGSVIYIPDNRNKSVYALSGQELRPVVLNNETLFRDKFSTNIDEKNLIGIYDRVRKQYWLADNTNHWCQILDETVGNWTANYEFSANGKLTDGIMADKSLFLVGKVGNLFSIYTMYTGTVNQLFGQTVTPRVTVVVNPDPELSKTFDDQMFAATERLDKVDWLIKREQQLGNQSVTGTTIDVSMLDGNYRVKTLRDNAGARLRGLRLFTTVKWKAIESALSTIYTKWRSSSRQPF